MNILHPLLLTSAVVKCHSQLEKIAEELRPRNHPDHEKIRQDFMEAVDHYRSQQVERYFEEAVCYYTQTNSPYDGMRKFCLKFGLDPADSCISLLDYIRYVAAHKSEISKRLSQAEL